MEKLGTTNTLAGYGYVFDRYVKGAASLSRFPPMFYSKSGKLYTSIPPGWQTGDKSKINSSILDFSAGRLKNLLYKISAFEY